VPPLKSQSVFCDRTVSRHLSGKVRIRSCIQHSSTSPNTTTPLRRKLCTEECEAQQLRVLSPALVILNSVVGDAQPHNQAKLCLLLRVDACAGGSSKDCFHCLESRCVRFFASRQLLLAYGCDASEKANSAVPQDPRCPMAIWPRLPVSLPVSMRTPLACSAPANKHVRSRSGHLNAKKCDVRKIEWSRGAAKKRLIRNTLALGAGSITH
jgi:hypothetical protein